MLQETFGLLLSALAVASGVLWFLINYLRMCGFERTVGMIADYKSEDSANGMTLWRQVIRFHGRDGRSHSVISPRAYFPRPIEPVGSAVELQYPPHAPEQADLYGGHGVWFQPAVLTFAGVAAVLYQIVTSV